MKKQLFLLIMLAFLTGWNPAAVPAWNQSAHASAVESVSTTQPAAMATCTPIPVPSATPGLPAPDVLISDEIITTYMYRLDENGMAIWYETGQIGADQFMLRGRCSEDGYAQIEYRDLERPGWWKVEFIQCIN